MRQEDIDKMRLQIKWFERVMAEQGRAATQNKRTEHNHRSLRRSRELKNYRNRGDGP